MKLPVYYVLDTQKPIMTTHLLNIPLLPPTGGERRSGNVLRYKLCAVLHFIHSFQLFYFLLGNHFILVHIAYIVFLENTAIELLFGQIEDIFLITLLVTTLPIHIFTLSFFTILDSRTILNLALLKYPLVMVAKR